MTAASSRRLPKSALRFARLSVDCKTADFAGSQPAAQATHGFSALRLAVINRKITNGFRSSWAAQADAALRTVIDTERLQGLSPYHARQNTITA